MAKANLLLMEDRRGNALTAVADLQAQPRRTKASLNAHLALAKLTLEGIVRSPSVVTYAVGITSSPLTRLAAYRRYDEITGYAFLALDLCREDAWVVERELESFAKESSRRGPLYKKLVPRTREATRHIRSASASAPRHHVYVIW